MKRIGALILSLLLALPALGAGALRTQATGAATSSTTVTATLTGVQAGDLLTLCLYERDGANLTSVGDSVNGAASWTQAVANTATYARTGIYYFQNSAAGNPLVTLTFATAGANPDINVAAWSGMATSSALNTTNTADNAGATAHTSGSVTPASTALILSCLGLSGTHGGMTPNTGFTALNVDAGVAEAEKRYYAYKLAHTGAINATHTSVTTRNSDANVAAFLEATSSQSVVPHMIQQSASNDSVFDQRLAANSGVGK